MTTLYLIRHGETQWNVEGRIQGHSNCPLNANGYAQARRVAQLMANFSLQAIYTSDLDRAIETAAVIADCHPPLTPRSDARLREVFFGEWEGLTAEQVTAGWPREAAAWRADSLRHRPPGGETLETVQIRVSQAIANIITEYPRGEVAIVGHSGSLRAVVAYALTATPSVSRHFIFDNCSLSTIEHSNDRFSLVGINDHCHLNR